MPAVSKDQGRFFRWAEHNPDQAKAEGKATGMTTSQMHDFAVTPEKGLPNKVGALTKTARKRGANG
jgi:hypothetical protein